MTDKSDRGPVQRILIVRLSALGDVVMASGLVPALRTLYPEAEFTWLTQAACAPLLRHNPRLDHVLVWPRERWRDLWRTRQWRALWREVVGFTAALRAGRFDLVLDAQGLLKSGIWARLAVSRRRIGLMPREGTRLMFHERVEPPAGADVRMGSEYRFLAKYLGAADASFQPDLAVGEAPRARARAELVRAGVAGRYAVICPYTTRPQKHWFDDHWVQVINDLDRAGLRVVILGGPADRTAAEAITAVAPRAVTLAGRLALDESVAAVADAALLIGVDTGLTHMGSALGVPTVALFGSTRPYRDAAARATRILYEQLPCSPCGRHPTCGGRFDCMKQLSPRRVVDEALRVSAGISQYEDTPR